MPAPPPSGSGRRRPVAEAAGPDLPRRTFLQLAGGAALVAGAAACGAGSHDQSVRRPTPTTTASRVRSGPRTFTELDRVVSGGVSRPGGRGFGGVSSLLYDPRFASQSPPAAIARCRNPADVAACVRYAADGHAALRIRGGGHSYGGWSSGTGLVADLGPMTRVQVSADRSSARIEAGALLVDVYAALAAHGVAIGAGSCPSVGVTGLTLGGGVGVLTRAYGLACDQVTGYEVVTADGQLRTVEAHSDPSLFWALRGGGGSFAAVTSLTFAVRRAPTVTLFFLSWPWSAAAGVLSAWQPWVAAAPRELWSTAKLLADPGSGLRVTVSGTWIGSGSVEPVLARLLRRVPPPSSRSVSAASYGNAMLVEAGCSAESSSTCLANALSPARRAPFTASSSIVGQALPEAGVATAVQTVAAGLDVGPGVLTEAAMAFDGLGGAVADIAPGATAFPWRQALATVQHSATWPSAQASTDPSPFEDYVHGARRALQPWCGTAAYANYADPQIRNYQQAYWGDNLPRLQQVKRSVDPDDVFTFPQAVRG